MSRRTFTDEQEAVIAHRGSHALARARPGSGKTTTAVERLAQLVEDGADPTRCVALMFNRSAKADFIAKLRARRPRGALPGVHTLHAFGRGLLLRVAREGLLRPLKEIAGEGTLKQMARAALTPAWRAANGKVTPTPEQLAGFLRFIAFVKADHDVPDAVFVARRFGPECPAYIEAYQAFERARRDRGVYFYDDLITDPLRCLEADPALRDAVVPALDDITVDEFQDLNRAQYQLLGVLSGRVTPVLAIGDERQAIYGFRGADPRIILERFPRDYSPTLYPMTRTFRFGHRLALAASYLGAGPEGADALVVAQPGNPDTEILRAPHGPNDTGLVPFLVPLHQRHALGSAAVLTRFYAQTMRLELELQAAGIRYHVYGAPPLVHVPAVAALVGVLGLASQRWPEGHNQRALCLRALLATPALYLRTDELDTLVPQMAAALDAGCPPGAPLAALAAAPGRFRPDQMRAVGQRVAALNQMAVPLHRGRPPRDLIEHYMRAVDFRTGLRRSAATPDEAREGLAYVDAFIELAGQHRDLPAFLDALGGLAGARAPEPPAEDHLSICTIHATKGAEFDCVCLLGWEQGEFPREGDDEEEERRLAYVAATRARRRLIISHPRDAELDRLITDPAAAPDHRAERMASPFVYDADLGLADRLGGLLHAGRTDREVHVRGAGIAQRYLAAAGADVALVEHGTPPPTPGDALRHPIPRGSLLRSPQGALHRLLEHRTDGAYLLVPEGASLGRWDRLDAAGWEVLVRAR